MGIRLLREKKPSLTASLAYRLKWLPIPDRSKLKFFLNLEWIFERLSHEVSYAYYGSDRHPMREASMQFLLDPIDREDIVLDLGCSTGEITRRVAERAKRVVGIDLSPEAVDRARHLSPESIEFHCCDARDFLTNTHERFDVLILSHVLEHLDEPETFLKEVKGRFRLIYVEVPDFDRTIFNPIRRDLGLSLIYSDSDHVSEFDRQELASILSDSGLTTLSSEFRFGVQRHWCSVV